MATSSASDDEELVHTKTLFRRYSKGPVMFNGCSPSGDVVIIDNISQRKSYNITGWYIERETDTQPLLRYILTGQFIIPPLTTIELWSSTATQLPVPPETQEQQQQSFVCIRTKLPTWNIARRWSVTRLFDHTGREKAIFSHKTLTPIDEGKNPQ
ncbi:unnamed protein product [Rotaria magnacalcarata]|uniref:LTD domain-containing protein n=1 Tax=Rotaria magnacalcarata TaxID=392030 RepID=A0A815FER6_9BILA|nr:unnamed protein product [Rotaria magnacalcarata]CAF1616655.1 unnamed protein product [Rotaria magnacalcarata]CAF2091459.1 unnamed protein product [Rotaria magnacalcarata]CAF2118260.1 unnamed protein product [Rotaria magnacalcarata]CAF4149642.1 unnamed protein product [Rotaria magnacalcarata]